MKYQSEKRPAARIHRELQQEIPAEASAGVVQRLGHDCQLPLSAEAYQAMAQGLPLDPHERRKNNYDRGGLRRTGKRADESAQIFDKIRRRRGYLNWNRRAGRDVPFPSLGVCPWAVANSLI